MKEDPIQHDAESGKFYIQKDGDEAYLMYQEEGTVLDFYETYVPTRFRGQGIAARVVETALVYARDNGYKVRPTCPYVATYMERKGDYEDVRE